VRVSAQQRGPLRYACRKDRGVESLSDLDAGGQGEASSKDIEDEQEEAWEQV
jgi:hypothetical protein